MNLPNKITMSRLVLTALFVTAFSLPFHGAYTIALLVFILAALTDYLDGEIARRRGLVTNFGKLMDPLVDKVLMAAAFVLLTEKLYLPGWVVVIVLMREFLVTGLRLIALEQNAVLAAESLGKHKTAWQIAVTIYLLTAIAAVNEQPLAFLRPIFEWPPTSVTWLGNFGIFTMTALTLLSGWGYFWKNRALFHDM